MVSPFRFLGRGTAGISRKFAQRKKERRPPRRIGRGPRISGSLCARNGAARQWRAGADGSRVSSRRPKGMRPAKPAQASPFRPGAAGCVGAQVQRSVTGERGAGPSGAALSAPTLENGRGALPKAPPHAACFWKDKYTSLPQYLAGVLPAMSSPAEASFMIQLPPPPPKRATIAPTGEETKPEK